MLKVHNLLFVAAVAASAATFVLCLLAGGLLPVICYLLLLKLLLRFLLLLLLLLLNDVKFAVVSGFCEFVLFCSFQTCVTYSVIASFCPEGDV